MHAFNKCFIGFKNYEYFFIIYWFYLFVYYYFIYFFFSGIGIIIYNNQGLYAKKCKQK